MKTIAIIDRHPVAWRGIAYLLQEHFDTAILLRAENISNFQREFPDNQPELIILSLSQTPDADNMKDIGMVKGAYISSDIILYDEYLDVNMLPKYLDAGVHGYLSKQEEGSKLIDCVMDVVGGNLHVLI